MLLVRSLLLDLKRKGNEISYHLPITTEKGHVILQLSKTPGGSLVLHCGAVELKRSVFARWYQLILKMVAYFS